MVCECVEGAGTELVDEERHVEWCLKWKRMVEVFGLNDVVEFGVFTRRVDA
jgi:hypothetical protein